MFALGDWPWKLFSYNTASVPIEYWGESYLTVSTNWSVLYSASNLL
jgi:hypothetical protein